MTVRVLNVKLRFYDTLYLIQERENTVFSFVFINLTAQSMDLFFLLDLSISENVEDFKEKEYIKIKLAVLSLPLKPL